MTNKFKHRLRVLIVLLLVILNIYSISEAITGITGSGAIVINSKTNQVYYAKNADIPRPIASMTKLMSIYLILEEIENNTIQLDSKITVSNKAVEISNKMNLNINISGLFSKIIRAINDYPKMSKSLKCSSIDLNINKESLKSFILNNKDNNYIYEVMLNSTNYSIQQLMEIKKHSKKNDKHWEDFKVQYIEDFWDICKKWRLK